MKQLSEKELDEIKARHLNYSTRCEPDGTTKDARALLSHIAFQDAQIELLARQVAERMNQDARIESGAKDVLQVLAEDK